MSTDALTHPPDIRSVAQGRWRIDPARSCVEFRALALWGSASVKGQFERGLSHGLLGMIATPSELVVHARLVR